MQDGAARILQLQLGLSPSQGAPEHVEQQRQVLEAAFKRLISRDPRHAWTSGQWMTERSGGSDVSGTETVAVWDPAGGAVENGPNGDPARIPGPWSISGFKWFSSATDAGMAVLLAQVTVPNMSTSSSSSRSLLEEPHGSGLTAFFAPTCLTHRSDPPEPYTLLNGIRIARLKRKLGTVSLPTAELELSGTRAWVLGRVGEGIRTLAPLLAVTRVHSAVAAVGYLGRGLAIARAWARVRKVAAGGGKTRGKRLLMDTPLHVRTLAEMHGEYRGLMLFVFWVCGLMGMAERADSSTSSTPPASTSITLPHPIPLFPASLSTAAKLFRLITPVLKAHVCHATIPLLHSCVEALGGVGYMLNAETEHLNVARLFRDACVLPVWEGTTDVLAVDFMRAATARGEHAGGRGIDAVKALDAWFDCVLDCGAIAGTVGTANGERWKAERDAIRAKWCRTVRDRLLAVAGAPSSVGTEALLADARMVTTALAEAIIAVLLLADAAVVDDDEGAAVVVLRRHLVSRGFLGAADVGVGATSDVATQLDVNRSIIWGSRGAASKL